MNESFLFEFFPWMRWQMLLCYLVGLVFFRNKFRFTMVYLAMVGMLLFFYRKPWFQDPGSLNYQVCNIDGTCRNLFSTREEDVREIWSPAHGRIEAIVPEGNEIHVIIRLNLINVHAQYIPYGGIIKEMRNDGNTGEITIGTRYGDIRVVQMAGFVTWPVMTDITEGEHVERGQWYGFIHLGSRVDLYLPRCATMMLHTRARVHGRQTIIAVFPNEA